MDINLSVDDSAFKKYLDKLEERGSNLGPLLAKVGEIAFEAVQENFDEQGRPKWVSLKSETIKEREKLGYTGPILQRTGKLKRSITKKITSDSAIIGTNLEYAAIQHFGGTIRHPGGTKYGFYKDGTVGWKKKDNPKFIGKTKPHSITIPARPFITVIQEDIDEMQEVVLDEITKE